MRQAIAKTMCHFKKANEAKLLIKMHYVLSYTNQRPLASTYNIMNAK